MYKELFVKSWKDLRNNPILFLPDIIIFSVNAILGLLFLKYSGLLKLITDPELLVEGLGAAVPMIKLFFKENLLRLIITLSLFVLTSFIIGSGLTAMKLGMIKELINKKRLTIRKMIDNGKYVWQVIAMKMILFAIGVVLFLFIFGTGIILAAFLHKGLVIVIMGLFVPIFLLIVQLLLFFRYPAMFLEEKHPFIAVKESFDYFLKNKKHVFIVWLIIILISLIAIPLDAILGLAEQKLALFSAAMIFGYLLRSLIKIAISIWSEVFKFRSYKSEL